MAQKKQDSFDRIYPRPKRALSRLSPVARMGFYIFAGFLFFMMIGGMFVGGSKLGRGSSTDNAIASIFSQNLSAERYYKQYQQLRNNQEAMRKKGMFLTKEDMERDALKSGVSSLLVDHALDSLRVAINDDDVQKEVQSQLRFLPDRFFFEDGSLNVPLFEQAIGGIKITDFIDEVERSMRSNFTEGLLASTTYVSQLEILLKYNEEYAKKEFSLLEFSLSDILDEVKQSKVSQSELKKFYASSPRVKKLQSAEKRSGIMWEFKPADYGISITDKQIETYYKKHKDRYIETPGSVKIERIIFADAPDDAIKAQDIKKQLQEARKKIEKNHKDFAKVGKSLTGSSVKTETITDSDKNIDPVLHKTVQSFAKVGDLSHVIKTKEGFELVHCVEKTTPKYKKLDQVKEKVKSTLLRERFNKRFQQDARRVASSAQYKPSALQDFVKRHKGKGTKLTKLPMIQQDIRTLYLFSLSDIGKMKSYLNEDGSGIIMECTEIVPAQMPKLEDVKSAVEKMYYQDKAEKELAKKVEQAAQYAQDHSMKKAAAKYKGKVSTVVKEYKDGKIQQPQVLRNSSVAKKVRLLQSEGMVTSAITYDKGVVLSLDHMAAVDEKLLEEKRDDIRKQILQQRQIEKKNDFIAALYRRGKLTKNVTFNSKLLPKHLKDV